MLVHLGMSGSLRIVSARRALHPHDRVALRFAGGKSLRLRDPRRFGAVLWTQGDPLAHPLLAPLGPEPLEEGFDGGLLHRRSRGRRLAVKAFIMDGRLVALGRLDELLRQEGGADLEDMFLKLTANTAQGSG